MRILAHLVTLPLAAFALLQIARSGTPVAIFVWLAASAVLHDVVLLPFYSALDRVGKRAPGRAVNFIRVPAGISLLLLLVFYPAISGRGSGAFHGVSGGLDYEGYLARWLLITAGLFAVSTLIYAGRRAASRHR
jgi:ABC-type transport system involved in cytochrome c biogenesis permease component